MALRSTGARFGEVHTGSLRATVNQPHCYKYLPTMPSEKVWTSFETRSKDGRVMKLRIQDLPAARLPDALDLIISVFIREETIYKAVDIANSPSAVKVVREYYSHILRDPTYRTVICCSDDADDVKGIMGVSMMRLSKETMAWIDDIYLELLKSPEKIETCEKNITKIHHEMKMAYDPIKELKLDIYYEDEGGVIYPAYRGLGIGDQFLKVRIMMCEAHKVPMTGAWMTTVGSQVTAARAGWKTVCEISYEYLAKKYGINFAGAPPTMKYMVARTRL